MRIGIAAALALFASQAASKPPESEWAWKCDFDQLYSCNSVINCAPVKGSRWSLIYPSDSMYWRCDTPEFGECDAFEAMAETSGDFRIFDLKGQAAFVKVGSDLSATEVFTIGSVVTIAYGQCEEAPPPIYRRG